MVMGSSTREACVSCSAHQLSTAEMDGYPQDVQSALNRLLVSQELQLAVGCASSVWDQSETAIYALGSFPSAKLIKLPGVTYSGVTIEAAEQDGPHKVNVDDESYVPDIPTLLSYL